MTEWIEPTITDWSMDAPIVGDDPATRCTGHRTDCCVLHRWERRPLQRRAGWWEPQVYTGAYTAQARGYATRLRRWQERASVRSGALRGNR